MATEAEGRDLGLFPNWTGLELVGSWGFCCLRLGWTMLLIQKEIGLKISRVPVSPDGRALAVLGPAFWRLC